MKREEVGKNFLRKSIRKKNQETKTEEKVKTGPGNLGWVERGEKNGEGAARLDAQRPEREKRLSLSKILLEGKKTSFSLQVCPHSKRDLTEMVGRSG